MGSVYASVGLSNLFNQQSIEVDVLVDTGATFLCVTEEIATQLGFDATEVSRQVFTLADGREKKVPKIAPVEIRFENRSYVTEAVVLGDECLMGVLLLEAMDLLVDARAAIGGQPPAPELPGGAREVSAFGIAVTVY